MTKFILCIMYLSRMNVQPVLGSRALLSVSGHAVATVVIGIRHLYTRIVVLFTVGSSSLRVSATRIV